MTVRRPSDFLVSLGAQERTNCDQLTAVKTGYPPTSITWPYRGLKCRPIEVEDFFWSYPLTNYHFQMIAGSSLFFPRIHIKYVVFMSLWPRTIRILISNWLRKRKLSQFFFKVQAGKTFSYHGHALVTLYVQFLYSDWSKFDRWVHA